MTYLISLILYLTSNLTLSPAVELSGKLVCTDQGFEVVTCQSRP